MRARIVALALAVTTAFALPAHATPTTNFWAPSTPAVQPYGVLHWTYDTYFGARTAMPIDVGPTIGLLPWKRLQAEAGFDLFYPTMAGNGPVRLPVVLNAKLGAPEDVYFKGQPAWSFGVFGAGTRHDVNDQNILYAMLGKTLPYVGALQAGAYYGGNAALFRAPDGSESRSGVLAGWVSPAIAVPHLDKVVLTWDLQTGRNVLGATGGGAYAYFTPAVALLTGPVFFFEKELQPGGTSWLWSLQLDVDLDLLGGSK